MNPSDPIDLSQVPTAALYSEIGKRRGLLAKTHRAGPGRPKTLVTCEKCSCQMGLTEKRKHRCEGL